MFGSRLSKWRRTGLAILLGGGALLATPTGGCDQLANAFIGGFTQAYNSYDSQTATSQTTNWYDELAALFGDSACACDM